MKKKNIIGKNTNKIRLNDSFEESFQFRINDEDKESFRLRWLDAELEKIDYLLRKSHKDYKKS